MERKIIEKRMQVFLALLIVIFLILISKLSYMQLIQTDKFQVLARENQIRLVAIAAPRGEIFDRNEIKLVGNQPVYTVSLVTLGQGDNSEVVQSLAGILGISRQEIQQKIEGQRQLYEPVKIATKVSAEKVTMIEERRLDLPGVVIDVEPAREYPEGFILAQTLGYVREINGDQLAANKDKGYKPGDMFGQSGLEAAFEEYLRGQKGARQVEVDSLGRPVRDLGVREPVSGNNLVLTIDQRLQKAAEDALADALVRAKKMGHREASGGAAVVLNVRTGEVLAMASQPSFDLDQLTRELSPSDYNKIFNSPLKPVLNRVLQVYPPGSVFKMVVAAAGLETGKIKPTDTISDPGYFFWGRRYNDWKPGGHGRVDLLRAIKVSCDTYFYQAGLKVGIDDIAGFASEFGLGQKTGIELGGEEKGVVPGPSKKFELTKNLLSSAGLRKIMELEQKYGNLMTGAVTEEERLRLEKAKEKELEAINWELVWHDSDTVISSIGQGINSYTPLQLANYIAAIANGGIRYKPFLVQKVITPEGKIVKEFGPEESGRIKVSQNTLAILREGMRQVALPPDGTAAGVFAGFPFSAAAKTGTAEVAGHDDHALIVAFAPFENPEIALAVVIDYGGKGSAIAGPAARKILDAYFSERLPQLKKQLKSKPSTQSRVYSGHLLRTEGLVE